MAAPALAVFGFFAAAALYGAGKSELKVAVKQLDAAYDQVLLLSTGKSVVGYDPRSLERRIRLDFDTYITCGDTDAEGRLYLGDQGARIGDFGQRLYILDRKGRLAASATALPSPSFVAHLDGKVYADTNIVFEGQRGGLNIFDARSLELLYTTTELAGYSGDNRPILYKGRVFLGVIGENGRSNRLYIINPDSLESRESEKLFDKRFPSAVYSSAAAGGKLFIVYSFARAVAVFSLDADDPGDAPLAYIDLREEAGLWELAADKEYFGDPADGYPDYFVSTPQVSGDSLYLFVANGIVTVGEPLRAIIEIDIKSLKVKRSVRLTAGGLAPSAGKLRFVSEGKAFIYDIGFLSVFDLTNGKLVDIIDLSR